jgi:uncharacterized protein (TIGR02246 family)
MDEGTDALAHLRKARHQGGKDRLRRFTLRRIAVLAILLIAIPSFAQTKRSTRRSEATPAQKQQFADDQEAINALHDKDIQASLALDADALQSLWADDIVTIAPGGPPIVGKAANRAALDKHIEEMRSTEILAYNEQFQEIQVVGDWAFEYGTITGRTRPFKGGQEQQLQFNVMRILKRQPDTTWRIARSIYNDATPVPTTPEQPKSKKDDRNKLED